MRPCFFLSNSKFNGIANSKNIIKGKGRGGAPTWSCVEAARGLMRIAGEV